MSFSSQDTLLYIPFIYYMIVMLFVFIKQGFSIVSCIMGLYMVMSGLSIPLYYDGYIQNEMYPIILSPSSTLAFCLLPTFITIPFYQFNSNKKRRLNTLDIRIFNVLSWMSIVVFFILLLLFLPEVISRFTGNYDIADLRSEMLSEDSAALGKTSGLTHYIAVIANILGCISWVAFPLTFYSICFLDKPKWFNALLALSGLSCMVQSIILIDRSTLFFLIIRFVFSYFLFRPYFSSTLKRKILIYSAILLGIAFMYLLYITISRFAADSLHSLLYYFGQNYLFFSTFWNDIVLPQPNFSIFHPIYSYLTEPNNIAKNAVEYGKYVADEVGCFVNVFYTFMGSICLYAGKSYVTPFCIVYFIFTKLFISNKGPLSIYHILLIATLAQVPLCGVITYIYTEFGNAIGFVLVFSLCLFAIWREHKSRFNLLSTNI